MLQKQRKQRHQFKSQTRIIMKKNIFFIGLFLSLLYSCSKNDSLPPDGNNAVTANIEGDNFKSSYYHLIKTIDDTNNNNIILELGAFEDNGDSIIFVLYNFQGVGKYTLNNDICCDYIKYANGSVGFDYSTQHFGCNGTGEINITYADDNKVEGTFLFNGKSLGDCNVSKSVTNGKFSCKFQN